MLFKGWMDFFFEPQAPANLALCRILFFGAMYLYYLGQDLSLWGTVSSVFWLPIWTFQWLPMPIFSSHTLEVLQTVWKVALGFSCLGLLTRSSTAVSFVLGFYLLGLPHNLGKIHHVDALVVIVFGVIMCSRCGDAWSLDRFFQQRNKAARASGRSGEYTWPVRTIWVMFALIFFAAGFAKLKNAGLDWVLSEHMAVLLIKQYYWTSASDPMVTWGLSIAQHPWLSRSLAAGTLFLELGYPLALASHRLRLIFVPVMLLTQIMIRIVMGPSFVPFMLCNLFWVPWERLISWGKTEGLTPRYVS